MTKQNPNMVLVETERYGGKDRKAINKHVRRTYLVQGITFYIDKVLDSCPQYYELFQITTSKFFNMFPHTIRVQGQLYWGDGLSWHQAESLAYPAILTYIASKGLTK